MKEYYYSDGKEQFGPFDLDGLKKKNISKHTLIWYQGIEEWIKAGEIDELKDVFKSVPPPLPKADTPPTHISYGSEETTYLLREDAKAKVRRRNLITGVAVVACLLVGAIVVAASNNNAPDSGSELTETEIPQQDIPAGDLPDNFVHTPVQKYTPPPKPREKTVEELQAELYRKESKQPLKYLSETHELSYRILSGKDQISGEIYNAATMATFKDVVLTVTYSTHTGTELYREDFVIYKYCYPGQSTSFVIKTVSPSGTRKIGVDISGAGVE